MRIIDKKILAIDNETRVSLIEVEVPLIAEKAKAGEFAVIMATEKGERIPLTIVDTDIKKGAVVFIFQEIGFSTKLLGSMNKGDELYSVLGPLGHPTCVKKYGRVITIAGGVGIAEIFPVARDMKQDNHVTAILGARTKSLVILKDEIEKIADEFFIATDDGSLGIKGFNTVILDKLLKENKYDLVYAVGPIPMMKQVFLITKKYNVDTIVSLNALMVDATGMCGSCRVTVGGKIKFSCVDGPEFDARLVDWENLEKRNKIYEEKEKHICRLLSKENNRDSA
ncbi:oxidoreductase FAD/NAD(P)-binding domain-containing protein [Candidatus Omnitrophus magneticus]|uniref:Oxidoreductase FAD/NAD(P)-binding domain-containing protein n=1 Tax=Candidatus Omnitrophus magneticus TaxID=1609969 RepID=A0A0F0CJ56_9BACT|nr:oxidoreductase FAD/NAD(P)-binding domain-containing protein [Candidatus Omnitrophus magneticus]